MSAQVNTLPAGFVRGDGRTAGQAARGRWSRYGWAIGLAITAVLTLTFLALTRAPTSSTPLSTNNAQPEGARAVAEVLRSQGVSVKEVDALREAGSTLGDDGTLVIAGYVFMSVEQFQSVMAWEGPLVFLAPHEWDLEYIDNRVAYASATSPATVDADCAVPAAVAAGAIVVDGPRVSLTRESALAHTCFVGAGDAGALVQIEREGKGPLTVIAAPSFMSNEKLALEGDAALALHLLGSRDRVAWYMAAPYDQSLLRGRSNEGDEGLTVAAPDWTNAALLACALTFLAAGMWRGRRMGALVTEPLPVIVPASEATRGRARLYRRGRASGHAAAALRAGAARRTAARLGLGPHATPEQLVSGIAAATGGDSASIYDLLYGPPPRDESSMLDLVRRLDALESEVDPT